MPDTRNSVNTHVSSLNRFRLFAASALALYTEVVLIRWMSAEIRMFAYLKNFTLLACFLGLGLGMMRRTRLREEKLLALAIAFMVLLLTFAPKLEAFPHATVNGASFRDPSPGNT